MDKILAGQPLKVPVMLVDSLWDQEDIYGAIAVYKAIKPKDTGNDKVFLVMGPWHHGQEILEGSALGAIKFNSDTALTFRQEVLRPFLAQYLKDGAPKADVSPVTAFETGTNTWRHLTSWPSGCASGCAVKPTPLYLASGAKLALATPPSGGAAYTEYVSDPARPTPYRPRPVTNSGSDWAKWLSDDQREASGRTDVAVFIVRRADGAGQDQRPAGREPDRLDERHRFRLGREGDRRLSPARSRATPAWAATS